MIIEFGRIKTQVYDINTTKRVYCRPCATCITRYGRKNTVKLDISRMLRSAREHKTNFDLLFCECISHETIHSVLWDYVGEQEFDEFDNLYQKLKNKKTDKLKLHKLGIGF